MVKIGLVHLSPLAAFELTQAVGDGRDDLEEVADDAVGGYFEDGGVLVPVDGDDYVGVLHADQVLDGAADAAGYVDFGADGFAGLAYLPLLGHPAGVDGAS